MTLTQIEIIIRRMEDRGFCYIATEKGKILPLFDFALDESDDDVLLEAHRILKSEPNKRTK